MRAMTILKWAGGILGVLLLLVTALIVQVWYFRPFSIDIFFERVFLQFVLAEPELMAEVGIARQFGYRGFDDQLGDASPAHTEENAKLVRKDLEQLHGYDRASLSAGQQLSYDILDWYLTNLVNGERWQYHDYPVNQLFGVQSETPDFMVRVHAIEDEKDAVNYNKRLEAFAQKFDGLLESVVLRSSKGVKPPRFVIGRVLEQMRSFVATPTQENILYTNLRDKLAKVESVSPARRTELLQGARAAIERNVYPAYRRLIALFAGFERTTQEDYGVWKLPDGDAFYDYQVRSHTTTSLDAQAVHDYGLAEVARIEQEMDTILRGQGLTAGSIGARVATLNADPRFLYPNDDAGREQCLADYQRIIDAIVAGLAPAFRDVPKLNIRVQRVPPFKEKTAPGAYADRGSLDGSRPSSLLREPARHERDSRSSACARWRITSRCLVISSRGRIANSLEGVPTFRKLVPFTAYDEGWGLYAERLAWEMGFEKDPLDDLGRLQLEMLRAVRLVVDTGIHRKHWTREQGIDYMLEKTGVREVTSSARWSATSSMPGQALAYKIGMRKILELRAGAQGQLGSAFDLREFHRVVLANGALPLDILASEVNAWVKRTAATAPGPDAPGPDASETDASETEPKTSMSVAEPAQQQMHDAEGQTEKQHR